jgi:curved DNA-binding protein CbpA
VKDLNIDKLFVRTGEGIQIPVSEVASIDLENGPLQINRDATKRRIVIGVNVRDADIQQVVEQIRTSLEKNIKLKPGYYWEYGGQFENLQNAVRTLSIVIPIALMLILLLLFFAFRSVIYSLVVFSTVPLSLIGGVVALWLRGLPFSISAGVGFIALFGVAVKIPAGVAEGMQVTINGKGNAGKHNGVPGDLLVLIEEEKHPELIRDESDLIYNLLLSVPTAALGGTVEIPTIDGKAKIKIEPGTQPGKVLRLRGKGLPNINSYGYNTGTGDLLVNISVYIPAKPNWS